MLPSTFAVGAGLGARSLHSPTTGSERSGTAPMSGKGSKSARGPKGKHGAAPVHSEETRSSAPNASSTSVYNAPTVQNILEDALTKVSLEYWAPGSAKKKDFDPAVVAKIYNEDIGAETATTSRLMLLELSFYLEKYVRRHFTPLDTALCLAGPRKGCQHCVRPLLQLYSSLTPPCYATASFGRITP